MTVIKGSYGTFLSEKEKCPKVIMITLRIPKKEAGKYREICSPSTDEKKHYRKFLPILNEIAAKECSEVVHGFMDGRSPVTNARAHIGYKYTLRFDLSDFFDCVKPEHVEGLIPNEVIANCFYKGRAYQGLPTSPQIANIAGSKIDKKIISALPSGVVYTRYADDLTFSFDDYSLVEFLKNEIPQIVESCGFKINEKKTWLQDSRFGARRVTGILVDSDIRVPREIRRKLRAATHQGNVFQARGLYEWTRLKSPNIQKTEEKRLKRFLAEFDVKEGKYAPSEITPISGTDLFSTQDPYYLLGINSFTRGWNDNVRFDSYSANKLLGSNVSAILLLGDDLISVHGVARREIKARALTKGKFYSCLMGVDKSSIAKVKNYLNGFSPIGLNYIISQ